MGFGGLKMEWPDLDVSAMSLDGRSCSTWCLWPRNFALRDGEMRDLCDADVPS